MKTITVTEAARHFSDLVNRVRYRHERAILLKGGRPVARIEPIQPGMTGRELAESWKDHPWLDPDEADVFGRDVESARNKLPALKGKWD